MSLMTDSASASGSIKKMIRDTNRLLSRPNLPADLRREQERKLSALQVALTDRRKAEIEREMAVKYRMVKFFERKKALRRLAAAQASGSAAAVAEAQLDLAYILHFPKDRKYISLYQAGSAVDALTEREAIRKQISEKLALLGAETMLAKVSESKKMKMNLRGSDDEESGEEEESDEEDDEDNEEDEEDDSEDEDSEDEESGDELSYDEDSEDLSDDDDEEEDSDEDDENSFDDSDDEEDSEEEDDEEEDSDDDEDDMDSEEDSDEEDMDSEEDSDEEDMDSEEDSDEEDSDEDSEEDSDEPKPKKGRH